MNKLLLVFLLFVFILYSCKEDVVSPPPQVDNNPSPETSTFEAKYAAEWMQLTYDVVSLEDIPAPTASRFYGYCGIAIYEAVYSGMPRHLSLGNQLKDMPQMPSVENKIYDWATVLAVTLNKVAKNILYQPSQFSLDMIDDVYDQQINERTAAIEQDVFDRSLTFGEELADKILDWSNSDNFLSTRGMSYNPPSRTTNPAFWEPTFPGQTALEPYLGTQRPFCMITQGQCAVPLGIAFDTIPGTSFYDEGYEVLDKSQNLTTDERNIAFFWEDKAGTGQPPGHWVAITNNMVYRFNLKLDEAAKLYALVGASIRDAFISAWETKYRVNLLRPKTYIRDYLGEPTWNELVSTPPFPEYPSGHSVVSGAVSKILTEFFGNNISFTDSTHHNEPGLRNRTFGSFYEAATEAAWSRLYGGIHFRSAILNGIDQGEQVANVVLNTIQFK